MRALLFVLLAAGPAAAQIPPTTPTGCRPMPECLIVNGPGPGDNEGGLGGMLRGLTREPPPAAMLPPPAPSAPAPSPPRPAPGR